MKTTTSQTRLQKDDHESEEQKALLKAMSGTLYDFFGAGKSCLRE